jgi:hypothetical protein
VASIVRNGVVPAVVTLGKPLTNRTTYTKRLKCISSPLFFTMRRLPSLVNGVGLRLLFSSDSRVQISPSAPFHIDLVSNNGCLSSPLHSEYVLLNG